MSHSSELATARSRALPVSYVPAPVGHPDASVVAPTDEADQETAALACSADPCAANPVVADLPAAANLADVPAAANPVVADLPAADPVVAVVSAVADSATADAGLPDVPVAPEPVQNRPSVVIAPDRPYAPAAAGAGAGAGRPLAPPAVDPDKSAAPAAANTSQPAALRAGDADGPDAQVAAFSSQPHLSTACDAGLPDAAAVHHLLKSLQGAGNQLRLSFIDALRMLHNSNLCFELGCSSYHQYCDRELGLSRTTAYEYLRVAIALDYLPAARALYSEGGLSWEQLRAISRVASADTETQWLEFAAREPVAFLIAEVKEALRTGRDSPRDRRLGLPNLLVEIAFRVTLEEKERVRAAFELVGVGAGPDLGRGDDSAGGRGRQGSDQRLPLVQWADGILSGAIPAHAPPVSRGAPGASGGNGKRSSASLAALAPGVAGTGGIASPAQTILYRVCPKCRNCTLDTEDGAVSVAPERLAELECACNRVVIDEDDERPAEPLPDGVTDPPNDSRLVRKVLHRDGLRCANPGCGQRRELHAHHIVFRSRGGRTVLTNEVAVCDMCHARLHQGLLEVTGSPEHGLTWRRHPLNPSVKLRDAEEVASRLGELAKALPPRAHDPRVVAQQELACAGGSQCAAADWNVRGIAETHGDGQLSAADASPRWPPVNRVPARLPRAGAGGGRSTSGPPNAQGSAVQWFSPSVDRQVEDLASGLVRLGWGLRESRERIRSAMATLAASRPAEARAQAEPFDEEEILLAALRGW